MEPSSKAAAPPSTAATQLGAAAAIAIEALGQEEEQSRRHAAFAGYTVDTELMAAAGSDARFLHCLPAHRGEEVSADVIDGPQSAVWQQAANRMHATRALLAELGGG